jgi:hypothetical protein
MRIPLLALLLACSVEARNSPPALKNAVAALNCKNPRLAVSGDEAGDAGPSLSVASKLPANSNSINVKCNKDVVGKFDKMDSSASVGTVKRGELDCDALGLSADMEEFTFSFHVSSNVCKQSRTHICKNCQNALQRKSCRTFLCKDFILLHVCSVRSHACVLHDTIHAAAEFNYFETHMPSRSCFTAFRHRILL